MSRPLRRSYFDLLKEKYPEPDEPGAAQWMGTPACNGPAQAMTADRLDGLRSDVSAVASPQRSRLLAVVLCLLAASLLILFLGPPKLPGADRRASELTPRATEPQSADPRTAALEAVEPKAEPTTEVRAPEPRAVAPKAVEPPVVAPRIAETRIAESRAPDTTPKPAAATPPVRRTAERTGIGAKVFAPQPAYPDAARRLGLEGSVLVEAGVDGSGQVSDVRVVEGSSPELDRAAVEALRQWRFEPARLGDEPLAYRYRQEFRFALELSDRTAATQSPAHRTAEVPQTLPANDEVTPPVKLATPLPGYTPAAWAAGVEGDVEIRATIDERGEVAGVEVVRGLPHGLTEAAVAAVRRWKFRPATRGGEPVTAEHRLSLRFAL